MHDQNQPNQPPDELTQSFWQAWREQDGPEAGTPRVPTPRLAHLLLQRGRQLLDRFQHFHTALSTLSRPAQVRWQRKLGASLAGVALTLALSGAPAAYAADFTASDATTLVATINAANDEVANPGPDTITLLGDVTLTSVNNTYFGDANGLPQITSAITIEGGGFTIARDASAPAFRILQVVASGDLTLNAVTITGGLSDSPGLAHPGGGIENRGTLTLNNSTISGNTVTGSPADGGGIANWGTLTLNNSTVSGNSGSTGGGIFNVSAGTATFTNSTVSGNSGSTGGGIFNTATLTLNNSTVSGNSGSTGGGIFNYGSGLILERSLISGNTAPSGQEIYNYVGGCLSAAAADAPTCLASVDMPLPATDPNLFGHSGESNAQAFVGFTPSGSDITATSDGTNPTTLAAILETTLQVNAPGNTATHALVAGSPAVDAASDGPATDQRGLSRPQGANFDIGAFELEQASNQPPTVAANNASVTVDEGQTAANTGTVSDPDNDPVTLSASVGAVVNNGDGTWSWSLNTTDGPPDSATVTITADDGNGGTSQTSFALTVDNVAPTISSVSNDGPITAGGSANITVNATDPAGANDPLAYQFDCDDNGSYEVGPQAGNSTACTFASAGSFEVNVQVSDGDGGVTPGSTVVTVNPANTPVGSCGGYAVAQTPGGQFIAPGWSGNVIVGTNGWNIIFGTNGADLILGLGGLDDIFGLKGNDVVCGGDSIDIIAGGDGADTLFGDAHPDWLIGGNDNDTLRGGDGWDDLEGNNGQDMLYGENGFDVLIGGNDNDTLDGGADPDYLEGGSGADTMNGGIGPDALYGGNDNDTLAGNDGDDLLYGNKGNDTLDGGANSDYCQGGPGSDTITACEGASAAAVDDDEAADKTGEADPLKLNDDNGANAIEQRVNQVFLPVVER